MNKNRSVIRAIKTTAPVLSRVAPGLASRWLGRLFLRPLPRKAPAREAQWLRGATPGWVPYDNERKLRTYTWGDEGPTAVLVHGWGGAGPQMAAFVEPLRRAGYRVVAFDHKGHGESDGKISALPEFARGLAQVAQAVGPIAGVVAHSLGCAATAIAIDEGLKVERAVFIAPPEDPAIYLNRAADYLQFTRAVAHRTRRRIERHFDVSFDRARISGFAHRLDVPLLVIHDEGDEEVFFWEGKALTESWPNARIVATQGLGHRRIVRDPHVVATGTDFIVQLQ